jgi:hypothetical protein
MGHQCNVTFSPPWPLSFKRRPTIFLSNITGCDVLASDYDNCTSAAAANDGKRLCEFYFGVPLYAAVALLLVGLAIADQPGTVTIASARLGQANATIRYQQTSKSSDPSGTTACRRLTC